MTIWLDKNDNCTNEETIDISTIDSIDENDYIFTYSENDENGSFFLKCKYIVNEHNAAIKDPTFSPIDIDLPYTVYYQTKSGNKLIPLSDKDAGYILNMETLSETEEIEEDSTDCLAYEAKVGQFAKEVLKYLNDYDELSKLLPYISPPNEHNNISILYNDKNLTSIFKVSTTKLQEEDYTQGGRPRNFSDYITNSDIGQYLYISTEWSNNGRGRLDLQSLINILSELYPEFIFNLENGKFCMRHNQTTPITEDETPKNKFINFLRQKERSPNAIDLKNIDANIQFNIGQPNTGKSYGFEESRIFDGVAPKHYNYLKIPVSGGVGNEYKGLQNTDLSITYDPIKKELRFGEFLQMLMSAIVNPKVPHVVFLDDFHNQDISSLLSEYTPLFKSQQKRTIKEFTDENIFQQEFDSTDMFIDVWNNFIDSYCAKDVDENDIPKVGITNRISGKSLMLVFPSNFYLLGAANFNENSLNIFADWEDRASINYIYPIESFNEVFTFNPGETQANKDFLECCKVLNTSLSKILKSKDIFDHEKYCFGMWKIVDSKQNLVTGLENQKKLINFFFAMIKNSLKLNNKNSEINKIGKELIETMQQSNTWFNTNIEPAGNVDKEILHKHNIYENEI